MEAIVAVYSDWGIGCCGTQPLVIPEDRRHFRSVTAGAAVIVGRRTLADFPGGRPLPKRVNIVLSTQCQELPGAVVVRSAAEAAEEAKKYPRCLVIGGESVYRQLFDDIDRVHVTKIDACPESDAFFPDLDALPDWRIAEAGERMEHEGIGFRFMTYERVRQSG